MAYQISSTIASLCQNSTPEAAMTLLRRAGFDGVDFPLSHFSVEPTAPLCREDWRTWVRGLKRHADAIGLTVVQAHAMWDQRMAADLHYAHPWEIFGRTMEACRILECRHLIFHPVRQPDRVDSLRMRRRIHDWNVRWFYELLSLAEQYDVIIDLENTFDSHRVQQPGDAPYPYATAEDMLALQRDIGSTRVQLCLDTGHANISGQNVPEMIRSFRGNLSTLHLNDNFGHRAEGTEDLHLFPGEGTLDWGAIMRALREIHYRGPLNIEPIARLGTQTEEERLACMRAAADFLHTL